MMSLANGSRFGPYEIVAPLGAGGMGEVYRATDPRLKRDVAIKVLPEAFAQDPDRFARFQREAELLASLNHPNIGAIYGLEHVDGILGIVLELVEGDTLDAHLDARGSRALPIADALPIARQIADALEAAHEKGVVHRDLKPANIKITPDGRVKVLDFGLAKMLENAPASSSMTMSPTLSVHATHAGMILGTAAYMSPEQARGKPVDRRTDVWAFGCVLYEMLTGKHSFEPGETVSDAIVAVLSREPDWGALPADTPAPIRRLLRRCLQKDVQNRLPHMGAARLEIDEARTGSAEEPSTAASPKDGSTPPAASPGWHRAVPWAIAAGALVLAGALLVVFAPWQQATRQSPLRLSVDLGADVSFTSALTSGALVALSPDGSVLAFVAQSTLEQPNQLYVRRLHQLDATLLPGTEGAANPFFSPDGQWIGFFVRNELKKISVNGGAAVTVSETQSNRGGAWSEDETIIFGATNGTLWRVSSAGGKPEAITSLVEGEATQRWPDVLPGGNAVLFTSHSTTGAGFDDATIVVQPLPDGARKIVHKGGYYGRYVPSGHLVFLRRGTLFAAPFSLARLEVTGPPVPVVEGVTSNTNQGSAQFSVSTSGTLVYRSGRGADASAGIVWLGVDGKTVPLRETTDWTNLLFAPDGRRFAIDIFDGKQTDIWAYEWARDTLTRLTFGPGDAQKPVWTPDGTRLVFASTRNGQNNLYWQRADGTGDVQRLTESRNSQGAWSWHPNGRLLAFHELTAENQDDVLILPIEGDETTGWKPGKPIPFLAGPFSERAPMFSPDGNWLAYQSAESGRDEVYVQPYPGPGGKQQISTGGGTTPTWSRTKQELFYGSPEQQIMVAPYAVDGHSFRTEKPRQWSDGRFRPRQRTGPTRSFDLHPDGTRFALAPASETPTVARQDKLVFVVNFFDELRRVAPAR